METQMRSPEEIQEEIERCRTRIQNIKGFGTITPDRLQEMRDYLMCLSELLWVMKDPEHLEVLDEAVGIKP